MAWIGTSDDNCNDKKLGSPPAQHQNLATNCTWFFCYPWCLHVPLSHKWCNKKILHRLRWSIIPSQTGCFTPSQVGGFWPSTLAPPGWRFHPNESNWSSFGHLLQRVWKLEKRWKTTNTNQSSMSFPKPPIPDLSLASSEVNLDTSNLKWCQVGLKLVDIYMYIYTVDIYIYLYVCSLSAPKVYNLVWNHHIGPYIGVSFITVNF